MAETTKKKGIHYYFLLKLHAWKAQSSEVDIV